jgi:hypothetical protein
MKLTVTMVVAAGLAAGQTPVRPGYLGPPLRPEIGPAMTRPLAQPWPGYRATPHGRGAWWAQPGWMVPELMVQPAAPAPPKEPALVVNKDYVKERLSPQTTLFPEGSLPPPVRARPHPPASPCTVRYKDGPVEKGRACHYEDEVLVYLSEKDRQVRVSIDLVEVDWP